MVATQTEVEAEPRWRRAGPPYELTRGEIVALLREQGYIVTERQLQVWATRGILPPPTRKLPRGATDGAPRAIYPGYMATAIRDLLDEARQGRQLAALKEAAPSYIEARRLQAGAEASPLTPVRAERQVLWKVEATPPSAGAAVAHADGATAPATAASACMSATGSLVATGTVTPRISRALSREMLAYARRFAEKNGTRLKHAALMVEGEDGQRLSLTLSGDETQPADDQINTHYLTNRACLC